VETGWNTSAVALENRRRCRKGNPVPGGNWVTMSLGDINTKTWCFMLGVGRKANDLAPLKKLLL
jgi:hypothetical protein